MSRLHQFAEVAAVAAAEIGHRFSRCDLRELEGRADVLLRESLRRQVARGEEEEAVRLAQKLPFSRKAPHTLRNTSLTSPSEQ